VKKITITIPLAGPVEVKTAGYSGSECKAITKGIESAIGSTTKDTPTQEMGRHVEPDSIQNI
jgi:hypothetical protein